MKQRTPEEIIKAYLCEQLHGYANFEQAKLVYGLTYNLLKCLKHPEEFPIDDAYYAREFQCELEQQMFGKQSLEVF